MGEVGPLRFQGLRIPDQESCAAQERRCRTHHSVMNMQLTDLERGNDIDESHHTYVVRGSAVERLVVAQESAGSTPVAPPIQFLPFQRRALESFRQPAGVSLRFARGLTAWSSSPSVAQMVEQRPEEPSVAGSIPARGTAFKLKLSLGNSHFG